MYIDALREGDTIHVVERSKTGARVYAQHAVDYSFFYEDPSGKYESIFGTKLAKVLPKSGEEFNKLKRTYGHKKLFESDANLIFRCLEQNYRFKDEPSLHVAMFDIETAFDTELGYSSPEDAFNPITSIAVYLQWLGQVVCLAVPPSTMTFEQAQAVADQVDNVILFKKESDMLNTFLNLIEDADVLSGWNSEGYDIPYTVNRVAKILGRQEVRRFCLWNKTPKRKTVVAGGREMLSYELVGRVHLDYMVLYKKYNYEQRQSYSLDSISEIELGEKKVQYDGTLDQLYKFDFKKFLEYNIQDTMLLDRLDKKLQFIDLANKIAHDNLVLFPNTMGTVSMVEQVITIEAHDANQQVPNRKSEFDYEEKYVIDYGDSGDDDDDEEGNAAAGGWVICRQTGLVKWVGSSDINSLYPSVIRALNMSPETLVGQIRTDKTEQAIVDFVNAAKRNTFSEWWNDRFSTLEMENFFNNDNVNLVCLDFEDGNSTQITGAELRALIFDSNMPWCISANGTIFRKDREGVIPRLLGRWYAERKQLQKKSKAFESANSGIRLAEGDADKIASATIKADALTLSTESVRAFEVDKVTKALEAKDYDLVSELIQKYHLEIQGDRIFPIQAAKPYFKEAEIYWDKRQLVKKINLNSAYGGILNPHMKFFDQRIGQSTTLTGRQITKHMSAKSNEMLCGVYDHNGKCLTYSDTDSVYFTAWPEIKEDVEAGRIEWNRDIAVELYDTISDAVSDTFPDFMKATFNVDHAQGNIIKSGREIVAETGLFVKKKRYALYYYDKDGNRVDKDGKGGKIKITGLDLRRSDTPKFMQNFLKEILESVLKGSGEDEVIQRIREFKLTFKEIKPWLRCAPRSVNNLTSYKEREEAALEQKFRGHKVAFSMPGHVRAALNWNYMRERHRDLNSMRIVDGQKIVVCPLKPNDFDIDNIAYPVDELRLPEWFLSLPFDEDAIMTAIVDKKIKNLLSVLKWNLNRASAQEQSFESLFSFD